MEKIKKIIDNALAMAGYDMYLDKQGNLAANDKAADRHYHIELRCEEDCMASVHKRGEGFFIPACCAKWLASELLAELDRGRPCSAFDGCIFTAAWRAGVDYDVIYIEAKLGEEDGKETIAISTTDTIDGSESVEFEYCTREAFEATLHDVLLSIEKLVKQHAAEAGMPDDEFKPAFEVEQECDSCGHKFTVNYRADGTYAYVNDPCDCEADFHPAEGLPSIREWLEALQSDANKEV